MCMRRALACTQDWLCRRADVSRPAGLVTPRPGIRSTSNEVTADLSCTSTSAAQLRCDETLLALLSYEEEAPPLAAIVACCSHSYRKDVSVFFLPRFCPIVVLICVPKSRSPAEKLVRSRQKWAECSHALRVSRRAFSLHRSNDFESIQNPRAFFSRPPLYRTR